MIRIDERTVELTDHELACVDAHGAYLDEGHTTREATELVREHNPGLSPEFIAYLNE